jgi:hypothetical protein
MSFTEYLFLLLFFCGVVEINNLLINSASTINVLTFKNHQTTKQIIETQSKNTHRRWVGPNWTIYSSDATISSLVGDMTRTLFYFTDSSFLRKCNSSSNSVTIISGNFSSGFSGDNGPADLAQLNNPQGVWTTTSGILFIADTENNRIRRISENIITTVAGSSSEGGFSGDNGPATVAELHLPTNIYVDSQGNLFIADYGNHLIRLVNYDDQIITTFAGSTANQIYNGDNLLSTLAALDPIDVKGDTLGNIYIADFMNSRIRIIHFETGLIATFLGNHLVSGSVYHPIHLWFDSSQSSLYYHENSSATESIIRQTAVKEMSGTPHHSQISVLANDYSLLYMQLVIGTATNADTGTPGPATSAAISGRTVWTNTNGLVYLMDYDNYRIRRVNSAGIINNYGGTGSPSTAGTSGPIGSIAFSKPWCLVGDTLNNFLYFTDQVYIWKIVLSSGFTSVFAGIPGSSGFSGDGGPANISQVNSPQGLWLTTGGDLYFADKTNQRIRMISTSSISNIVTTVVGSSTTAGFTGDSGAATLATLSTPTAVYVDTVGQMFIADNANNRIRFVDTNHIITTFAGSGGPVAYTGDNIAAISAPLNGPRDVKGDSMGNIFISDTTHKRIRKVDTAGIITTFVGAGTPGGFTGGIASATSNINTPYGMWFDSLSNMYFCDVNSVHKVFFVSPPTSQPSGKPTIQPSGQPTAQPVLVPTNCPSVQPSSQPTAQPVLHPTSQPTGFPSRLPTNHPSAIPSSGPPVSSGGSFPSCQPSARPSAQPSRQPTAKPSGQPTSVPSCQPSARPSAQPSRQPTAKPSGQPTSVPSCQPSARPSGQPSRQPTAKPSGQPTKQPGAGPTGQPSRQPIASPSCQPSTQPTGMPSEQPSSIPSSQPTLNPTTAPTLFIPQTLKDGLVAYYPFDGNAQDKSGNHNHGTVHEASLTRDRNGIADSAYSFDGANSYIYAPGEAFNFRNTMAISLWLNPCVAQTDYYIDIISKGVAEWYVEQNADLQNHFYFGYTNGTSTFSGIGNTDGLLAASSTWTHLVLSKDAVENKIHGYVNLVYKGSVSFPDGEMASTSYAPLIIGAGPLSAAFPPEPMAYFFCGSIDEIYFYNRTLQYSEIVSLFHLGAPSSLPTGHPTSIPSGQPIGNPTTNPSDQPTAIPSKQPTRQPIANPSRQPTSMPSGQPTGQPAANPSGQPTKQPVATPTGQPSKQPIARPSCQPSSQPTAKPSEQPSSIPSSQPILNPTTAPTLFIPETRKVGLVAYYPFDGNAQVKSGNHNHGTVHEAGLTIDRNGIADSAYFFNGNSSYIYAQGEAFTFTNAMSVSVWIKPCLEQPVFWAEVVTKGFGEWYVETVQDPIDQYYLGYTNGPDQYSGSEGTNGFKAVPNTWTHLVFSKDAVENKIHSYVNLNYQGSISYPHAEITTTPESLLTFGGQPMDGGNPPGNVGYYFCGSIDEVYIYNRTLPYTEIVSLFQLGMPSSLPTKQPTSIPSRQPSTRPSANPSVQPTSMPSKQPIANPSGRPSCQPTSIPSRQPSSSPSCQPTSIPSRQPICQPTSIPSRQPSARPSDQPTSIPSSQPITNPSVQPTSMPSKQPIANPSGRPSCQPTSIPSRQPSSSPSCQPTSIPSRQPSAHPSDQPTSIPSSQPITNPSVQPTSVPSSQPIASPSGQPTSIPSRQPTGSPSCHPTSIPSKQPNSSPSCQPTSIPSRPPSACPSDQPTSIPSRQPSACPSGQPTSIPSKQPNSSPSCLPTTVPSSQPICSPSRQPISHPSGQPISCPSVQPSSIPTSRPSARPICSPSFQPSGWPTAQPSSHPSIQPIALPTSLPSDHPTSHPSTVSSSLPTGRPSVSPICCPSSLPSRTPSSQPSGCPSSQPIFFPTCRPSSQPTGFPSNLPSVQPSNQPTIKPSMRPTAQPSIRPTCRPTNQPSNQPSSSPTETPSDIPTSQPSQLPTPFPSSSPTHPTPRPTVEPTIEHTNRPVTEEPTLSPSSQPSVSPSSVPFSIPTIVPTRFPSSQPSSRPSGQPSDFPSDSPTGEPTACPTNRPKASPSAQPTSCPSSLPSSSPLVKSSGIPTAVPSAVISGVPTVLPSVSPSVKPSTNPTICPSVLPTFPPTFRPTPVPSILPTFSPTVKPTFSPSVVPTAVPTSRKPTILPTPYPTFLAFNNGTLPLKSGITVFSSSSDFPSFKQQLFMFYPLFQGATVLSNITISTPIKGSNLVIFGSTLETRPDIQIGNSKQDIEYERIGFGFNIDPSLRSMSILGDINNDNNPDLVIGDPVKNQAYVLFGNNRGFTNLKNGFTIKGENSGDNLGWAVSSAGDFNDDGFEDILASAWMSSKCYVIFGKAVGFKNLQLSELTSRNGLRITGNQSEVDQFGLAVSGAGDFNADGYDDIIITGRGDRGANIIYLIYGFNPTSKGVNLNLNILQNKKWGIKVQSPDLSFAGLSLTELGDINGDEFDDIAIGSVPYRSGLDIQTTYVIYGNKTSSDISLSHLTPERGMKIIGGGIVVSRANDVDGDGVNDIMVVDYPDWQGQTGSFLTPIPDKRRSRKPSTFPTSQPTKSLPPPTDPPSSRPSIEVFVSHAPSQWPTSFPSGKYSSRPTIETTSVPTITTTTRVPTVFTSKKPSLIPSAVPSKAPSFSPSISPSFSPSFSPSTRNPSFRPTKSPTVSPTINQFPSSFPSASPTIPLDQPFTTKEITSGGRFNGTEKTEVFLISSRENTVITGTKGGRNTYKVIPRSNMTIIITNFHNILDKIDLTEFASAYQSMEQVNYATTSFLTLILIDEQIIQLTSHSSFDLSANNFIFGTAPLVQSTATASSKGIATSIGFLGRAKVLVVISCFVALLLATFLCIQWNERGKKEIRSFSKELYKKETNNKESRPITQKVVPVKYRLGVLEEEDGEEEKDEDDEELLNRMAIESLRPLSSIESVRFSRLSSDSSLLGFSDLSALSEELVDDEEFESEHQYLLPESNAIPSNSTSNSNRTEEYYPPQDDESNHSSDLQRQYSTHEIRVNDSNSNSSSNRTEENIPPQEDESNHSSVVISDNSEQDSVV